MSSSLFLLPGDENCKKDMNSQKFENKLGEFLRKMQRHLDAMESEEAFPHKEDSPEQRSFKVSEQVLVHEEWNVDIREEQTSNCPRAAFPAHNQGVYDGRGVSPVVDLQRNQDKCMESEVLEGGDDEFREEFSCFLSKLRDHLDFTDPQHISHDLQENQPLEIMSDQIVEKFHIDAEEEVDVHGAEVEEYEEPKEVDQEDQKDIIYPEVATVTEIVPDDILEIMSDQIVEIVNIDAEEEVDVQGAEVDADEEPKEEDREDQKDIVPHELATVNEVEIVPDDISHLTSTGRYFPPGYVVPEFRKRREDDTEYVVTFMQREPRDPAITGRQYLAQLANQLKAARLEGEARLREASRTRNKEKKKNKKLRRNARKQYYESR